MFRSNKKANIALERLEARLLDLSDRLDAVESTARKLQLEWIETYDKVRHQLSRMAKRGTLPDTPPLGPNDAPAVPEVPQMDPISASIHARRSRSFLKPAEPEE